MPREKPTRPTGNHLLDRLPVPELDRLLADADLVRFAARQEVYRIGIDGEPVYFPTSGVYSLMLPMKDGSSVEVAVVDSEGMLGIPVVLGMNAYTLRAVTQVEGECVRIPCDAFLSVLREDGVLDDLVRRFLAVSWQSANQNMACALKHTVLERTCRWLLAVHDRAGKDEFEITQEVLAEMVGASRQKVTMVAGELQAAGYIAYQRGRMRMLDRHGLENTCCECYRTLRKAYHLLTSGVEKPSSTMIPKL